MRLILHKLIVVLMVLAFGLHLPSVANATQSDEIQLKAVFVLNFAKLTEWPEYSGTKGGVFTIVILGKTPPAVFKNILEEQTLRGTRITIKYIDSIHQAIGSQLLYISNSEYQNLPEILKELSTLPILTVSDMPGFSKAGGMIGLVRDQNHLGFEVNLRAMRKARLSVGSQLLKLAKVIYGQ